MKSNAQIAYEAYATKSNWKSLATGDVLPDWECLTREIKEAWQAAATAVIAANS